MISTRPHIDQEIGLPESLRRALSRERHVRITAGRRRRVQKKTRKPRTIFPASPFPRRRPSAREAFEQILFVFRPLNIGQRADQIHFDLRRQFLRNLSLRAAQNKGSKLRPQPLKRFATRLEFSADSNEAQEPKSPSKRKRKNTAKIQLAIFEGVPVRTIRCLDLRAKQVCVTLASGFMMNWPSSRNDVAKVGRIQERAVLAPAECSSESREDRTRWARLGRCSSFGNVRPPFRGRIY